MEAQNEHGDDPLSPKLPEELQRAQVLRDGEKGFPGTRLSGRGIRGIPNFRQNGRDNLRQGLFELRRQIQTDFLETVHGNGKQCYRGRALQKIKAVEEILQADGNIPFGIPEVRLL